MLLILYINAQQMHVSVTLLNWTQDTALLLKSSMMSGLWKIFWERKLRLYMSKPRCVCTSDMNLLLRASPICFQDTWSGTMNGILSWNHHSTEHSLSICLQNTGCQQEKDVWWGLSMLLTGSEKAQSHMMVAIALISWLPCTITTTGKEIAYRTKKAISYYTSTYTFFFMQQSLQDFAIVEFSANSALFVAIFLEEVTH